MAQPFEPQREGDEDGGHLKHVLHAPSTEGRPDFQEALSVLRMRKWSILAITLLVTGLALFLSSRQTPVYQSEASLLVTPLDLGGDVPVAPNLATETELVSSIAVAEIVAENLGIDERPRNLLANLTVESPDQTEILELSYRHTDPGEARRRAQAFAQGYLEYRELTVTQQLLQASEAAERELATLEERLDELETSLAQLGDDDPRALSLASEATLLQSLILQRQLDQLALPENVAVGSIVQSAGLPQTPVSPNHALNAGFGLVAGLALAIAIAFLRDRLAGRLRSDYEVEATLRAPVLAAIPRITSWRKRKEAFLVTRDQWQSPEAEAYRMLRTSVLSAASARGVKTLVVTSPHVGEGKSVTVANLGVALARAGIKVTLVSADLRKPRLHDFLAAPAAPGLVEVLQGSAPLEDVVKVVTSPVISVGADTAVSLRLLPSGKVPDDPAELLGSPVMERVLDELERDSDLVLIDSPPILPVTDALVLAPKVGGVLIVLGPRSTTKATVSSARQQLDKVGAHVLGVLVNGPDQKMSQTYYSY